MKHALKRLAHNLGYEIHKSSWFTPIRRMEMLDQLGINLVLDVGANEGTYGSELRSNGYSGTIYSFEPLSDAFAKLESAARSDEHWKAYNSACGARAATATINVARNSYSSSLLEMVSTHTASAPESDYISQEEISVCSLDECVLPSIGASDKVWLKIDTQGYESEVLKGAGSLISRVSVIECELSTVPLYEGQLLIDEMMKMIYKLGFRMVGVAPVFSEPGTGHVLQIDGTFLRV